MGATAWCCDFVPMSYRILRGFMWFSRAFLRDLRLRIRGFRRVLSSVLCVRLRLGGLGSLVAEWIHLLHFFWKI